MVISYTINKGASLITNEYRRLAGILIELSDRPVLYWASVCGFHPSNVSNWLRGRETLSEENQAGVCLCSLRCVSCQTTDCFF